MRLREQLPKEVVAKTALQVALLLNTLDAFLDADHVGFYIAASGECDPALAAHCAHLMEKKLYLPVMEDGLKGSLAFYPFPWGSELITNTFGIAEPNIANQQPITVKQLDCVLVPLVAFDENGHRLGRGAGCFDRYFSDIASLPKDQRPMLIGLAYEFQKIDPFIPDAWDVPLDCVVTEKQIYHRA